MANNHKNVIELNGKLYETKRGVLLQDASGTTAPAKKQVIDGFVAPKPQTIINPARAEVHPLKTLMPVKHRPSAKHHSRHETQKSTILMRKSVKKPVSGQKAPEIAPFHQKSRLHLQTDRANHTSRSPYINKYHSSTHQIAKRTEPIAVAVAPVHPARPSVPVSKPQSPSTAQSSKSEKLFAEALQKADSPSTHKKKKRGKAVGWSSGILAALLLVGFIAYLNLPNLNVKFAGTQAGFAAAMPGYKPSGYSFNGPVNYEAGKVTINYKSNTDDRSYSVKQEVSSWNSESLQENFLATNNKTFTTEQEGGRTVYMYDDGNATWVNGGVWYQIESKSLSSEQLLGIASSM